jgi:ATP-binding cassette, subfamily B, bacterial
MNEPQQATRLINLFPSLRKLGASGTKRRLRYIQQLSATECGAACLAMVLAYHGNEVPLEQVRQVCAVDRDGVNALAILNAANLFGLRGRGVQVELDELECLETGAILHWEFSHFVVFERLRKDSVDIVDPAIGRRRIPMAQFRKMFTGVALLLEPSDMFARHKKEGRLWPLTRALLGKSGALPRILVTSIVMQLFALSFPMLTGQLVDRVVPRSDYHLLSVLLIGLAGIVVFEFVTALVRSHLFLHLRTVLDARMTLGFLDHLASLPYSYFQLRSAGDLMMRLNSNSTVREVLTGSTLSGILDGMLVTVFLIILFIGNTKMALVTMAVGALDVLMFLSARRRQRELTTKALEVEAKSHGYQVEMLTGMEMLKSMGGEQRAIEHWSHLFVNVLNVSLARGRLEALTGAFSAALGTAGPLAILTVGALGVMKGQLSLGTMLALNAVSGGFLQPLGNLVNTALQLELLGSYLERINDVLDTPLEQDRAKVRPAHRLSGQVTLERVSFRYGPLAPLVVDDVSVEITRGQFVAIVGRSGSGKSTLARLLLALYVPVSGRILYDGCDLTELDFRSVRRQFGNVTQSHELFGTTIFENIALSDPSLPLEAVIAAAKLARIHEEIVAMPIGYHTPLVDRGSSLSGGQRQRIALARALVRKPSILLLDEATSALDAITEREIQQSLASLRCTRIVIAHRLSTVIDADLILLMENGRIVEQGRHNELMRRRGRYAELVASQNRGPY